MSYCLISLQQTIDAQVNLLSIKQEKHVWHGMTNLTRRLLEDMKTLLSDNDIRAAAMYGHLEI